MLRYSVIFLIISATHAFMKYDYSFSSLASPSGGYFAAIGVAIDKSSNQYVIDSGNFPNKIFKIDKVTNSITTLDTFSAIPAATYIGIATDNTKNLLYVVDGFNLNVGGGNKKVYQTDLSGNHFFSLPGPNGPDGAGFGVPISVTVDSHSNVYIVDAYNQCIYKYNGAKTTQVPITNGVTFNAPTSIDLDSIGNIYLVDRGASKVFKISSKGVATSLPGPGGADGAGYDHVYGVAVDIYSNIFVSAYGSNHIYQIDTSNNIAVQITDPEKGYGTYPYGDGKELGYLATIKIDANNNLYASANSIVFKISLAISKPVVTKAPVPMSSFSQN